jgi:hypothetical protein
MVVAGEYERGRDGVAVDRDERVLGVLLDDREEVAQQPPLALVQRRQVRWGDVQAGGRALRRKHACVRCTHDGDLLYAAA